MHDPVNFETRLGNALDRYADLAPVAVDAVSMTRVAARSVAGTPIADRWRTVFGRSSAAAVLLLALLAAAAIGTVVVGSRLLDQPPPIRPAIVAPGPSSTPVLSSRPSPAQDPNPAPSLSITDPASRATAATFIRPFEYVIPAGSAIRAEADPVREMLAWVDGPDRTPDPAPDDLPRGQQPKPWDVRGIVLGSGEEAWSHGNAGRFMLRTTPAEFLADLRDTGNVHMGTITETALDGRPALTVMLPGTGGYDIHVTGRMMGLARDFVLLHTPARLVVADIDGTTVFIMTWARTAADLDAWLPVAAELIASIHFVPMGEP